MAAYKPVAGIRAFNRPFHMYVEIDSSRDVTCLNSEPLLVYLLN
jgi:hypothetical protein